MSAEAVSIAYDAVVATMRFMRGWPTLPNSCTGGSGGGGSLKDICLVPKVGIVPPCDGTAVDSCSGTSSQSSPVFCVITP